MICSARLFLTFLLTVIFLLVDLSLAGVLAPTGLSHTNEIPSELFNSLSELSRLADISYCVGSSGIQPPFQCLKNCDGFKGFELVTTWDTGPLLSDSCGYIALSHPLFPKRIIVAFRGTHSISNILVDLSLHPQEYVPYIGDPEQDGDQAGTPQRRCENCTVHAGFLKSWHNARPTVLHNISEMRELYPDYELVLVGHSLGGAVAALAGTEMQLRGWRPQVTTFGEPRVGNEQFVRFFDETFALKGSKRGSDREDNRSRMSIRRVTHVNDPIPLLPFDAWGYKMHAGEIFISKQDLPVSKSDLTFCDGDQDQRCIAGAEEALALLREGLDQRRYSTGGHSSTDQVVLSDVGRPRYAINDQDYDQDHSEFYSQWSPIPPEFRLWELFFSHRDYITHLGLCFPSPLLAVE